MDAREKQQRIQKAAEKSLQRKLHQPERWALEEQFAAEHAKDSDEALYAYAKEKRRRLGGKMTRANTVGYVYLVRRLGPWDVFMGRIGKELSEEKAQAAGGEALCISDVRSAAVNE